MSPDALGPPSEVRALRGRVLDCAANPFTDVAAPGEALRYDADGAVVWSLQSGRILARGPAEATLKAFPDAMVERCGADLIVPGFIDAHCHYPQIGVIASWGAQLLDWLERFTFPEEARFADPAYAAAAAEAFLDAQARHGVTCAASFATSHPQSVDAFFEAASRRGLRAVAGKVLMDRGAPSELCDDPVRAYDETKDLIERWHGRGRLGYAITPRFALTSSPAQLEAAGRLRVEHPDCLMQTHLSENKKEISEVARLFPKARDYLDVYEAAGLIGPGTVFGHAIHLTGRERARLGESGSAVAHCPTSNLFIGSGLFDLDGLARAGIAVGAATDVGGGSSFSMLATLRAAYEISQLRGAPLHPAGALWLATGGAARALGLERVVGRLAPGYEADIARLDVEACPVLAARARRCDSAADLFFAVMVLGDAGTVRATYSGGAEIWRRGPEPPECM